MHHFPGDSPYKRSNAWGRLTEDTIFAKWMRLKGMTMLEVADLIGASHRAVKYWAQGHTLPGLLFAFKIQQLSKGKVPVEAWLETKIAQAKWHNVAKVTKGGKHEAEEGTPTES